MNRHRWHARHALAATALYTVALWPAGAWAALGLAGVIAALYLRARDEADRLDPAPVPPPLGHPARSPASHPARTVAVRPLGDTSTSRRGDPPASRGPANIGGPGGVEPWP